MLYEVITVLAGAMGPKALARAAKWADGVSGFTITANAEEAEHLFLATSKAWANEGKTKPPRQVTGFFCALGPDAENRLRNFTYEYLEVFGPLFARSVAEEISARITSYNVCYTKLLRNLHRYRYHHQ